MPDIELTTDELLKQLNKKHPYTIKIMEHFPEDTKDLEGCFVFCKDTTSFYYINPNDGPLCKIILSDRQSFKKKLERHQQENDATPLILEADAFCSLFKPSIAYNIARIAIIVTIIAVIPLLAIPAIILIPLFYGFSTWFKEFNLWRKSNELIKLNAQDIDYTYHYSVKTQAWNTIKSALKPLLFPLYLWGLGVKTLITSIIYPKASHMTFLPVSQLETEELIPSAQAFSNAPDIAIQEQLILMPNGAHLATYEISKKGTDKKKKNTPYIIYFGGNGSIFEYYADQIEQQVVELDAVVIGFHHSSFGNSGFLTKKNQIVHVPQVSFNDFVEEACAQVERLIHHGVALQDINLYGHSLGGTIATAVTTRYPGIRLFNHSSLSGTADFTLHHILPTKEERRVFSLGNALRIALGYSLYPLIKFILILSDWDIDASDYARLPHQNRDYITIYKKKESNELVNIIQDEVIPTKAAIHKLSALKKERKSNDEEVQNHARKTRHLFFGRDDHAAENGLHNAHLHTIQNHDGITGDDYFNNFILNRRST